MAEVTFNLASPQPDPAVTAPPADAFLSLPETGTATQEPAPSPRAIEKQDVEQARQTAKDMNAAMEALSEQYRFGIYQDTDQFYMQVRDSRSGKVVKTRPVQDLLDLHKRLQDMVGLVVDEEL